ncbi:UDP-N-acetylglucosamine 2-epimerase [Flavobacterium aurantiibacter]|uniref:UDP-N-acetylglucosamine 2-epimerase (Hydrolyzing) n=1 Tax=Flavobacterium aurantiibacter TaxID=2023067 RepID=A0A255ZTL6_9FLAO|nr:UDP-N-acetylglucosamine 2-epimerase [Flavobacterium aurantiibacter]OYQ44264.1 UDP-N-acetylglucosamine 2-epimerase (hydrolyzing) [Flavobacterium aurantiibacter]
MKRKIAVVITARPSYSRVKTVLTALKNAPDVELQLIVAASALLDRYGNAVERIEADGFEVTARVFNVLEGENLTAAAKTTGIGILELSTVFDNLKPDIVVSIADRFETIATAISASYMNIPLAHIQGGEVTGNIDEKVRHAVTKLADYHFVASEGAKERVIKLGENPDFVFNTGCPSIDLAVEVLANPELDFDPYQKYGGVGEKPDLSNGYLVVMQHPVTNEYTQSRQHIEETFKAVIEINLPTLWFWPNIDAGADGTSTGIRAFRENNNIQNVHFFKNMDGIDFLRILANAKVLVGNSSVGIREAAFLGVPVVNVGTRQNRRDRAENVVDVVHETQIIKDAIQWQIERIRYQSSDLYGDGSAGKRIANLLTTVPLHFHKTISY